MDGAGLAPTWPLNLPAGLILELSIPCALCSYKNAWNKILGGISRVGDLTPFLPTLGKQEGGWCCLFWWFSYMGLSKAGIEGRPLVLIRVPGLSLQMGAEASGEKHFHKWPNDLWFGWR